MKYLPVVIAMLVILGIVLVPRFYAPLEQNPIVLSDTYVTTLAQRYVETSVENARVTNAQITEKNGDKWKITVTYQQGTGANCKLNKCYWEGPAAMYCRSESNQTLGICTS